MGSMMEYLQTTTLKRTPKKPSALRRQSCDSVTIVFLDREAAIEELRECAQRLIQDDARVLAVGLFGSLARGDAVPSSDADVLIVLETHDKGRWVDRIPEYIDAFDDSSLGAEPFPYVLDEINKMLGQAGFMRAVVRELAPLAGNPQIFQRLQEWTETTE